MPRFRVSLSELQFYHVDVDAADEDEAEKLGLECFDRGDYVTGGTDDLKVAYVEPLDDAP
jgi:hypothetical protein